MSAPQARAHEVGSLQNRYARASGGLTGTFSRYTLGSSCSIGRPTSLPGHRHGAHIKFAKPAPNILGAISIPA